VSQPLQEWLHAAGLTRVQGAILRVAQPSIRLSALRMAEENLARGTTKLGGRPDLASGAHWPERNGHPLPFVAQINLAEMGPYAVNHLLPSTGMLTFFFDVEHYFAVERVQLDQDPWWVGYFPADPAQLHSVPIPASIPSRYRYQPCKVTCTPELTLPTYDPYDEATLTRLRVSEPLTETEVQAYYAVQQHLAGMAGSHFHVPIHRVLGYADSLQSAIDDAWDTAADWQLLLQLDSDDAPDTEWGDTGRIYYGIRQQDLARQDFSQVHVILQCT
jgi:uncharacterized protein YwqG